MWWCRSCSMKGPDRTARRARRSRRDVLGMTEEEKKNDIYLYCFALQGKLYVVDPYSISSDSSFLDGGVQHKFHKGGAWMAGGGRAVSIQNRNREERHQILEFLEHIRHHQLKLKSFHNRLKWNQVVDEDVVFLKSTVVKDAETEISDGDKIP
ncbi:hypothetical protein EJB05_31670 [Eragrostis curvula]|uniref:Uncharacterized protein n=1 Tax=Eragrostis curvula TaxID=38414 RepID=A0A5J9UF95_9POAL|nr:hypothetical protein EJB05_31670 [Eragrostis curvula]